MSSGFWQRPLSRPAQLTNSVSGKSLERNHPMISKNIFLVLALVLVVGGTSTRGQEAAAPQANKPAQAQEISPEKRELVKRLVGVLNIGKTSEAMLNSMLDEQEKSLTRIIEGTIAQSKSFKELSPDERQLTLEQIAVSQRRSIKRMREMLAGRLDLGRITEELSVELYGKHFSENELRDLIAFYESPTGRKTIELAPTLFSEAIANAAERILPEIEKIANEVANEEVAILERDLSAASAKSPKPAKPSSKRSPRRPG